MAKKNSFFSRFRLVYRRSPVLLKCVVLAAIVLSIAALTVLRVETQRLQDQAEANRAAAAQIEQKNAELEIKNQEKETVDGIKKIAEEKLDLVDPDTVFFDVVTNQD